MNMKRIFFYIMIMMLCLPASCEKAEPSLDGEEPVLSGTSLFLPCNADTTVTVLMTMDAPWQILNNNEWVAIYPTDGDAGEVEIKMRIIEPNTELRERFSYFDVVINGETTRYCLFQRGTDGVELIDTQYILPEYGGGTVRMEVLANAEFQVESSESWAVVGDVLYDQDSTLLGDSTSYSALKKAYIDVTLDENTSPEQRMAEIAVSCGGQEQAISVLQFAKLSEDVDWSREFYRRSLAMKFTGQGCSNCPRMSEAFHNAQEQRPDSFEIMNIHSYLPTDYLYYDNASLFVEHYGIGGWPHAVFNSVGDIGAYNLSTVQNMVVQLVDEASDTPARTSVSLNSSYQDGIISLEGYIAATENGSYKIHIHAMENGIKAQQSGSPEGGNYIHDNVLRKSLTYELGDELSGLGANDVIPFSFTEELPESVFENAANAYLLVYITYDTETAPGGSVAYVEYKDFGMVVDNVVTLPMNGQVVFEYE